MKIKLGKIGVPRLFVVFLLLLLAKEHQPEKEKGAEAAKHAQERSAPSGMTSASNTAAISVKIIRRVFKGTSRAEMRKHEVVISISEPYSNITSAMLL